MTVRPAGRDHWDAVTAIKPGQFVIGSFFASDNTCDICGPGTRPGACTHPVGPIDAQAQYAGIPLAEGTLVATPAVEQAVAAMR